MFKNKLLLAVLGISIVGIMFYSLDTEKDYTSIAVAERADYKENMLTMEDSPIKDVRQFTDFSYFPADPKWVIQADFVATTTNKTFQFIMTDSSSTTLPKLGEATFKWNGEKVTVHIFDEEKTFLLPFRDATNGQTTYGGGRYINIPKENLSGSTLTIDFNTAHNFYCAYNEKYVCPIPPVENTLKLAVEAGEKTFKDQ
jgi:hypothetical protein